MMNYIPLNANQADLSLPEVTFLRYLVTAMRGVTDTEGKPHISSFHTFTKETETGEAMRPLESSAGEPGL